VHVGADVAAEQVVVRLAEGLDPEPVLIQILHLAGPAGNAPQLLLAPEDAIDLSRNPGPAGTAREGGPSVACRTWSHRGNPGIRARRFLLLQRIIGWLHCLANTPGHLRLLPAGYRLRQASGANLPSTGTPS
jgi:hypothetical protein